MREENDFGNSVANPYVKKARMKVTMNLDIDVIDYFKVQGRDRHTIVAAHKPVSLAVCCRRKRS